MSVEQMFWAALLLTLSVLLLGLPLWPAWSEWRHPRDPLPLHIEPAPRVDSYQVELQMPPASQFTQLQAQRILLGDGHVAATPAQPALTRWQPPRDARPWGAHGWHLSHDLHVPAGHLVPCSLVVHGRLTLDSGCRMQGDIKASGRVQIGAGSQVQGNVFSEDDVRLDRDSRIFGVIVAEGQMQLAPGVQIGTSHQPVSVCADVMDVHGPVLVHGSMQARICGRVHAADNPPDQTGI